MVILAQKSEIWVLLMFEVAWFFICRGGKKTLFLKQVQNDMTINYLFINHPSKMPFSPWKLFLIFWKIGCTKWKKKEKMRKRPSNFLDLIVNWSGITMSQKNGPLSMFLIGYFGTFNLYFEFFDKKNWDTL